MLIKTNPRVCLGVNEMVIVIVIVIVIVSLVAEWVEQKFGIKWVDESLLTYHPKLITALMPKVLSPVVFECLSFTLMG